MRNQHTYLIFDDVCQNTPGIVVHSFLKNLPSLVLIDQILCYNELMWIFMQVLG